MTHLEAQARDVLQEVGVAPGQSVLDFGCGCGTYTIPAADIVGEEGGIVYALDRAWQGMWPGEGLAKLATRVEEGTLQSIHVMKTTGAPRIDLDDASVDVAVAHDVLHSYYFSVDEIRAALREIYRVLKTGGFLSLYPGDPDAVGDTAQLRDIQQAVEQTGFRLDAEYTLDVVHEKRIVRGHVQKFVRAGRGRQDR